MRDPDFSFLRSNGSVGLLSLDRDSALFSPLGAPPLLPTQRVEANRRVFSIPWSRKGKEGGAAVHRHRGQEHSGRSLKEAPGRDTRAPRRSPGAARSHAHGVGFPGSGEGHVRIAANRPGPPGGPARRLAAVPGWTCPCGIRLCSARIAPANLDLNNPVGGGGEVLPQRGTGAGAEAPPGRGSRRPGRGCGQPGPLRSRSHCSLEPRPQGLEVAETIHARPPSCSKHSRLHQAVPAGPGQPWSLQTKVPWIKDGSTLEGRGLHARAQNPRLPVQDGDVSKASGSPVQVRDTERKERGALVHR